jgi:hypothetical protein
MSDEPSEDDKKYEFEKREAEAYRVELFRKMAVTAFVCFCLLMVLGFISWIVSGDIYNLVRTGCMGFVGIFAITQVVNRWTHVEKPTQPLPNHPDMDGN